METWVDGNFERVTFIQFQFEFDLVSQLGNGYKRVFTIQEQQEHTKQANFGINFSRSDQSVESPSNKK